MKSPYFPRAICLLFVLSFLAAVHSSGQTFTFIASFTGTNGSSPYSAVIWGGDGNLYGTTSAGGAYGVGTVFKCTPAGTLTTLHSFNRIDGADPRARLVQARDGRLYGTTSSGGTNNRGTVFKITATGTLTTLHNFSGSDGAQPLAGLVQAVDGSFYGTTSSGGAYNLGTVFKVTSLGTLTRLHSFNGLDGADPRARLLQARDGKFYGTSYSGGATAHGTIFTITSTGALTTLHSFSHADGANPKAGLVQARDGNFYGTTFQGGKLDPGLGSVFRITPAGTLTTLHFFSGSSNDYAFPETELVEGVDKNFYGTTYWPGPLSYWAGTIFRVTPEGTFTMLHKFNIGLTGFHPAAELVQAPDLSFYGTTLAGGRANRGTIFKMVLPLVGAVWSVPGPSYINTLAR